MTEEEWLTSDNPTWMLKIEGENYSLRKRQLCCLACWEAVQHLLNDEWAVKGLVALQCHAEQDWHDDGSLDEAFTDIDGALTNRFWDRIVAGDSELWNAAESGSEATLSSWGDDGIQAGAAFVFTAAAHELGWVRSLSGMRSPISASELATRIASDAGNVSERVLDGWSARERFHANVLRDIFGNPFRPVTFDPAWRTDTAVSLARGMYESRDFAPMPILADALQDAGCDSTDILNHCRDTAQVHVRGCWVVDLVLGKE